MNFCIYHATKKTQNKWEHYETEQIKTCMFLTVRGRANKAELFLEPRKKKKKNPRCEKSVVLRHMQSVHVHMLPIQALIKLHQWGK